jgi:hypothetical protein
MTETTPSPGGRRFHKLRIAFSATCGVFCLLLIVLCVRSYFFRDWLVLPISASSTAWVFSDNGLLNLSAPWPNGNPAIRITSIRIEPDTPRLPSMAFSIFQEGQTRGVCIPHWSIILLSTVLVAAPWTPWPARFGLRTLLIGTTLIAAILGLVVWAVQ